MVCVPRGRRCIQGQLAAMGKRDELVMERKNPNESKIRLTSPFDPL